MNVDRQMQLLTAGAVDVISEAELRAKLEAGRPLRVKLGIDPTASDIHLGFAVVLRRLRLFQDLGHVAVLILGDFTAMVGDPSGRPRRGRGSSKDEVDAHAQTYLEQVGDILDMSEGRLEIRRNSEWLAALDMEDILRLTSQVTVARMLERDDFANRYRDGVAISLMEFLYPLLQGRPTRSRSAPTSSSAGPISSSTCSWAGTCSSRPARSRRSCSRRRCSSASTASRRCRSRSATTSGSPSRRAEQFGKLMSIPDDVLPMYFRYATAWPPEEIDEDDRAARERRAASRTRRSGCSAARSSTCTTARAPAPPPRPSSTGCSRRKQAPTDLAEHHLAAAGSCSPMRCWKRGW